jgi:hypothetical protein
MQIRGFENLEATYYKTFLKMYRQAPVLPLAPTKNLLKKISKIKHFFLTGYQQLLKDVPPSTCLYNRRQATTPDQ